MNYTKPTLSAILLNVFVCMITLTIFGNTNSESFDSAIASFNMVYGNSYDLTVSKTTDNIKVPLYIVLPGGIGAKRYPKFKNDFIMPSIIDHEGVVFSPKLSWKRNKYTHLEAIILDFVTLAKNTLSVDPNKIIVIGYSNGGMEGVKLVENNDALFSNLVIIASTFKMTTKFKTPTHIVHGTKDRYFRIKNARKAVLEASSMGCNIAFLEAQDKHDYGASQYIEELSTIVSAL